MCDNRDFIEVWQYAKALMIISRYLMKEVLNTTLAVTFVLLLIFLSNTLVRYLSYAASGKIAANVLFQLMGFEIPFLVAILLPLGLYLGVVLAYGRLYADSELRVLHACGFTVNHLVIITGKLAVMVSIVTLALMLWLNPAIAAQKEQILREGAGKILETLMPGRFQVSSDGKRVVYVEKIARNRKQASNLFIADQKKTVDETNNRWLILSAATGYQAVDKATNNRFIIAQDGYRYEGVPGENDYRVIQFDKYAVRMPDAVLSTKRQVLGAISTTQLLKHYDNADNAAELQWRLSIPLSAILLALIAVPLSQVKPRQGRYSMLFFAILIYVLYVNLLFVARNLIEQKMIPLEVGMWWVHLLAFGGFMLLLLNWRKRNA